MSNKAKLLFKSDAPITSVFGVVRNFGKGLVDKHDGVDYGVSHVPLYAPYDGTVIAEGMHGNGEIYCWVEVDGQGIVLEFGHLSQTIVSKGQKIKAGEQLGVTGNTGNSFDAHLHVSCFPKGQENIWPRQINNVFKRDFIDFETWQPKEEAAPQTNKHIYTLNEVKNVNGIWQLRCNYLVPIEFSWNDNGIPLDDIHFVDSNGNFVNQRYDGTQTKFVFRDGALKQLTTAAKGSGGYYWVKFESDHGEGSLWLSCNDLNDLINRAN